MFSLVFPKTSGLIGIEASCPPGGDGDKHLMVTVRFPCMSGQCVCVCLCVSNFWRNARLESSCLHGVFRKLHYCVAEFPAGTSADPGNTQRRFVRIRSVFMGTSVNPWLLLLLMFILSCHTSRVNVTVQKNRNKNKDEQTTFQIPYRLS